MRMTLHLVTAADYPVFWTAHAPSFRQQRLSLGLGARGIQPAQVDELVEQALAYAERPQSNQALTKHLTELAGELDLRDWWWVLSGMTPFVHAAGQRRDRPPGRTGGDRRSSPRGPGSPSLRSTPTSRSTRWSGAISPASARPRSVTSRSSRDSGGRGCVLRSTGFGRRCGCSWTTMGASSSIVPDGLFPDPDVPAPVRYLPMWDSVLLAYEDRARLIPPAYQAR